MRSRQPSRPKARRIGRGSEGFAERIGIVPSLIAVISFDQTETDTHARNAGDGHIQPTHVRTLPQSLSESAASSEPP